MALFDAKVMEDLHLSTGDGIEITGKKKTYALLWSTQALDYGSNLVRIDGYTRNNRGVGMDESSIDKADDVKRTEQVILSTTEELNMVGLAKQIPVLL